MIIGFLFGGKMNFKNSHDFLRRFGTDKCLEVLYIHYCFNSHVNA